MRRRLVIAATIGVLVAVAGVLYVAWSLDSRVKRAIEHYGSAATSAPVRVDSVSLSLLGGSGVVNALTVANPSGFSAGDAFSLGRITLTVDRGTLRDNPIVVDEITIVAPQVRFELNQAGDANLDVIRRNIAHYLSGASGDRSVSTGGPQAEETRVPGAARSEPRRVVIRRLSIQGAQVAIEPGVLGGERMVMELPDTNETDIGARSGGATGAEVAAVVARALLRNVATTVAAAKVQRSIEKGIGGEAGKALGKGVGDAVKGVGKAVNDLFGDHGD